MSVLGLSSRGSSPIIQPLAASIRYDGWPLPGQIEKNQADVRNSTTFKKLDKLQCFMQYASPFGDGSDLFMVASGVNSTNSSVLACGTQGDTGTDLVQSTFGYTNTCSCKKLAGHGYKSVQEENLALAHWNIEAYEIE